MGPPACSSARRFQHALDQHEGPNVRRHVRAAPGLIWVLGVGVRLRPAPFTLPASVIWATHMKTTVDIADPILQRAKRLAHRRKTTLKALIEEGLRRTLEEDARPTAVPLRTHTFRGRGLQPGLSWDDWSALRSFAYEGLGG